MTNDQCEHCKYASWVSGYPDGQDMFTCDCEDPKLPFDMDDDTFCPCFILDEEYKMTDYGDSFCPYCGGCLATEKITYSNIGQDGYNYFEENMICDSCGKRYHRECDTHIVVDRVELTEIKEDE